MNVGKKYSNENLGATNPNTDNGRSKQLQNVKYFNYLGCLINYARYAPETKFRVAKAAFNKKNSLFTSKHDLNLRNKPAKCYIWSTALCGAKNWTLWKVDHKCLGSFEMWRWRRVEKMSWTDHMRNKDVLCSVKEERNILQTVKEGKIGHFLHRNCIIVTEGKIGGYK